LKSFLYKNTNNKIKTTKLLCEKNLSTYNVLKESFKKTNKHEKALFNKTKNTKSEKKSKQKKKKSRKTA